MIDEFFDFPGLKRGDASNLSVPRTKALLSAIERDRTFRLVEVLLFEDSSRVLIECLIVTAELHGVPDGNPAGIRFRERLSIAVSSDEKCLPEVWAMRKDFPRLQHQNGVRPGMPKSLCLYFEPPSAVLRTWTPQKYLARIHWWMNQSAEGTLHQADQPLDAIFFSTKYELLLPWNFDSSKSLGGNVIEIGPERSDGGITFRVAKDRDRGANRRTLSAIELHLPEVHHGPVEAQPETLGDLEVVLQERGFDLLSALKQKLQHEIASQPTNSIDLASDDDWSALCLYVPIVRKEGEPAEALLQRAFLLKMGRLALGIRIQALIQFEKKVMSDHLGTLDNGPTATWRAEPILGLELLRGNTKIAARKQSGVDDEGPAGVLLGAGSLGDVILQTWVREGWGSWTAIDKDHLRPHNLSRHGAHHGLLGVPKALAASLRAQDATNGANPVKYVTDDVLKDEAAAVREASREASLVIDVTTTLDYPRLAGTIEALPRHISTFITPDGKSAVLLAEDKSRSTTLLSLEAQYYRKVMETDWGATHLSGNLGKFWSGASCRDISLVLPYSRIVAHGGNLTEQIRSVAGNHAASIQIWVRDSQSGVIQRFSAPVAKQLTVQRGKYQVIFDEGLIEKLRRERSESAPNETGGIILGYVDLNINAIVIADGLSAPPDSTFSPTSFVRGKEGVLESVQEASRRTAGVVGYIGEWHCHPPGHTAEPSGTDITQLHMTSLGMAQEGLPALTLIIGKSDISVLVGEIS